MTKKFNIPPTHRVVVGAYVFDSQGRMLLLLRRDPPKIFAPPGGRLFPDENPFDGIRREVREEAGIEIELNETAFVWFGKIIEDSPVFLSIDFIAIALSTDVVLSDEHCDFIWATREQVESQEIATITDDGFGYAPESILKAFDYIKSMGEAFQ